MVRYTTSPSRKREGVCLAWPLRAMIFFPGVGVLHHQTVPVRPEELPEK
jgi:hypothetical protein